MNNEELFASAILRQGWNRGFSVVSGKGSYIYDDKGNEYLDLLAGIAVNSLGNGNPNIRDAVIEQLNTGSMLTSMVHTTPTLESTGAKIIDIFDKEGKVIFSSTGGEANERLLKLMFNYQYEKGHPEKDIIISMEKAFHGRTIMTMAAAGKSLVGYGPKIETFVQVPFNNIEALRAAVEKYGSRLIGILAEPIQGEGGVVVGTQEFLQECRDLCDKHDAVLAFDEVQVGFGRAGCAKGKIWAHELYNIKPDIMTSAKGLSGGAIPVAATLISKKVVDVVTAKGTKAFDDGSTFGGNPLALAAAGKAIDLITAKDNPFIGPQAQQNAAYFKQQLERLKEQHKIIIKEVRGEGLILALKLDDKIVKNLDLVLRLRNKGVATWVGGDNVLRMVPPLNISQMEIAKAISALHQTFKEIGREAETKRLADLHTERVNQVKDFAKVRAKVSGWNKS